MKRTIRCVHPSTQKPNRTVIRILNIHPFSSVGEWAKEKTDREKRVVGFILYYYYYEHPFPLKQKEGPCKKKKKKKKRRGFVSSYHNYK